jgi:hypothetical protein
MAERAVEMNVQREIGEPTILGVPVAVRAGAAEQRI